MNYATYRFIVEDACAAVRKKSMDPAPVEFRNIRISDRQLRRLYFKKKLKKKVKSLFKKIKRRFGR